MQFKSYIVEKNFDSLNKNIVLFHGENLGLKNDFKKLIKDKNKKSELIRLNQDEIVNYSNQVFPGLTTREETMRDRIARLIREINTGFDAFKIGRDLGDIKTLVLPEKAKASQNNSMQVEF